MKLKGLIAAILFSGSVNAQSGQIDIPRIDQMPNLPTPFNVRDWYQVAKDYDGFVYNPDLTGDYLPLLYKETSGPNYPELPVFGLPSYVGSNNPKGGEAINVLPSIVGATLAGIDKSNQNGNNWVLWSQNYFNKTNGQNIYLNAPKTSSGNDWWYDVMPNIYFYQLYDLYGPMGHADEQFTAVADAFAGSARALGGSDTPWQPAFFNYRAFDFATGTPNSESVPEPESAGTYAWLLYHAYKVTGEKRYLEAAEWCIEFLDQWPNNPSYELQLPYGAYTAAKMNAELHTHYDLEKMINWIFDRGALRGWGTIVGRWNGFDVSGLIGEANDNGNDYAFLMNGLHQAAALAPLVRYDKRYARAIGKWILNLANATRLYYPGFLPASLQDGAEWSAQYDPMKVVGHEALREVWNGASPFSTGDAVRGGWAATNLALYGSSSIGYLGGILAKTNVDGILRIDVRKTDFFSDGYPMYLYYNPYDTPKSVLVTLPDSTVRVYDLLHESFLSEGAAGMLEVTIPAGEATLVALLPGSGSMELTENRMVLNGLVIDYQPSNASQPLAPRIQALATPSTTIELGDSVIIYGKATDPDFGILAYSWQADRGELLTEDTTASWVAPQEPGNYHIQWMVTDNDGLTDTASLVLTVVPEVNRAPVIQAIQPAQKYIGPGQDLNILCKASDPNGDTLLFTWTANAGGLDGSGDQIIWSAPSQEGIYQIQVQVDDGRGEKASALVDILVRDFADGPVPSLLAYYPFSGNTQDLSGNGFHGVPSGARPTNDRLGQPSQAFLFDGVNDYIRVPDDQRLEFTKAITLSFWFKADALGEKERFIVSHGSWQSRWKVSIIPESKIRWTIHASDGRIRDLDASTSLTLDSFYQVTATYDGAYMMLYLNGHLESFLAFTGDINPTNLPILMGQMLPDNANYNFEGVLDEVKLWDTALVPGQVQALATTRRLILASPERLHIYPNPASTSILIRIPAPLVGKPCQVWGYDLLGRMVLDHQWQRSTVEESLSLTTLPSGVYLLELGDSRNRYRTTLIKN